MSYQNQTASMLIPDGSWATTGTGGWSETTCTDDMGYGKSAGAARRRNVAKFACAIPTRRGMLLLDVLVLIVTTGICTHWTGDR